MSTLHRPGVAGGRAAQALHRATTPDYFGWLEHTRTAGGCARPIRLTGTMTAVDRDTGRVLTEQHTDELPDRVLYKACGNRRARRTCATLLADLDVHPRVAMQILRHARFSVTMEIYTQVSSTATREALKRLGESLGH
ncbi:replication initiator [Micromonospora sp. DH13]|uniref:replication initiator n=1 Tax=unclassified Micromonospora TaxID=2617518 RepID=UPI00098D128E|nr:replication initiator [Micromonospora sp. DH13]OON30111.1 hypothetical protein BSA16_17970 [Micromonospora sp. Rc5]